MSNLSWDDRVSIGYALFDAGFKPTYSSNIYDCLTAGFGKLDDMGEWEYPVECLSYFPLDGDIHDTVIPWATIKSNLK